MRLFVAGNAQTLLRAILQELTSLTEKQALAAGAASRRLLEFAWRGDSTRNSWLVTNSLRSVCQTFATDADESSALLRRATQPEHLAQYGYEELPVITRELSTIARVAPDLAAEIYISVFTYREPSDETTNMSKSQILSLTSNRRQDYDMAKWTLAEFYPTFILQHPVLATTAMLGVIDAYRILEHASEAPPEVFRVNDQELTLVHDYSQMWDDGAASQIHTELKILNAFFRHLESLAQSSSDETTLDTVLNTLLRDARPAVIWSRLLLILAL
jgi:hypothetical protein